MSKQNYDEANERVHRYAQGLIAGHADEVRHLWPLIQQLCRDLNQAHDEILRHLRVKPEEFHKYDWPEWTPQANSIRWAEDIFKVRLAKTNLWTLYPSGNENEVKSDERYEDKERCHADSDGDCIAATCPQLRDNEPTASGRHCPLDTWVDPDR